MVARNRIRCLVVAVPAGSDRINSSGALARDVLPWADPYVAGLIKKLQDEVRHERRFQSLVRSYQTLRIEDANDEIVPGYADGFQSASEDDILFAQ